MINNMKCCLNVEQDKDRAESIVFCDMEPLSETQMEMNVEKLKLREWRQMCGEIICLAAKQWKKREGAKKKGKKSQVVIWSFHRNSLFYLSVLSS